MAGITAAQRELGWNVKMLGTSGIVPCRHPSTESDFLTVAEVRREVNLCSTFEHDDAHCITLIPEAGGAIIPLDATNSTTFPTPPPESRAQYYFVHYERTCDITLNPAVCRPRPSNRIALLLQATKGEGLLHH